MRLPRAYLEENEVAGPQLRTGQRPNGVDLTPGIARHAQPRAAIDVFHQSAAIEPLRRRCPAVAVGPTDLSDGTDPSSLAEPLAGVRGEGAEGEVPRPCRSRVAPMRINHRSILGLRTQDHSGFVFLFGD